MASKSLEEAIVRIMTFVATNTPFKEPSSVVAETSSEEGSKVVSLPVPDTDTLGDVGSVPSIQKYLHSEDSAVKETVGKESLGAESPEGSREELKSVPEELKGSREESEKSSEELKVIREETKDIPKESKDSHEESENTPIESKDTSTEPKNSHEEPKELSKEQANSPEEPLSADSVAKSASQPLAAKEPPPISIAASQAASTKPPRLLCVVPLELLQHHQSLVEARETMSHLQRELALAQCVLQLLTDSLHVALR